MGVSKFIIGIALMLLNFGLASVVPNYFSSASQNTIELLMVTFIILGIASPIVGLIEHE